MSVVVEESRAAGTAASAATSPAPPSAVPLHLVRRGSRARVRALSEELSLININEPTRRVVIAVCGLVVK